MVHSLCLLVKWGKTILPYNADDSDVNYVYLKSVAFTHHRLIEKHFGEKTLLPGAKKQIC